MLRVAKLWTPKCARVFGMFHRGLLIVVAAEILRICDSPQDVAHELAE